jgi:hypothetical protein
MRNGAQLLPADELMPTCIGMGQGRVPQVSIIDHAMTNKRAKREQQPATSVHWPAALVSDHAIILVRFEKPELMARARPVPSWRSTKYNASASVMKPFIEEMEAAVLWWFYERPQPLAQWLQMVHRTALLHMAQPPARSNAGQMPVECRSNAGRMPVE